ncbi:MAG: tRNA lysidine(34) synthetase TilS [Pseudomonadota bacterium]
MARAPSPLSDGLIDWFSKHHLKPPSSQHPIVLAVSGGADSMAMAHLFRDAFGAETCHVSTIDHGLRHGSYAEARWTLSQLQAAGFKVSLDPLSLAGEDGNTQALARQARYAALLKTATSVGASLIAVAQTLDDQAETVLARLARSSGTKGLSGMRAVSKVPSGENQEVSLIRPLLGIRREALRSYLIDRQVRWAEDPSNRKTAYDRIRFRALLKTWEEMGFAPYRIAATAEHLQRSDAALDALADDALNALELEHTQCGFVFSQHAFASLHTDTQLRVLQTLLQRVGSRKNAVRWEKLERARLAIISDEPSTFTLHTVIVSVDQHRVTMRPEKG